MEQLSVNIWGCCVSRDIFPRDTNYKINQYVSFISPMTLMFNHKADIEQEVLKKTVCSNKFSLRNFKLDYEFKSIEYLTAKPSDYLIIDMADARIPIVKLMDNYVTSAGYVRRNSDFFKCDLNQERSFDSFSDNEWEECIKNFCTEILKHYSPNQIILNECKQAKIYLSKSITQVNMMRSYPIKSAILARNPEKVNPFLDKLNSYCTKYLQGCHVIKMPDNIIGDAKHKWGLHPFHYHELYYEYAYSALNLIISGNEDKVELLRKLYSEKSLNLCNNINFEINLTWQNNVKDFFKELAYDKIHQNKFDSWLEENKNKSFVLLKTGDSAAKYFEEKLKSVNANIIFKSSKRLLKELSPEEFETAKKADIIVMCCVHTPVDYDEFNGVKAININTIFKL